MAVWRRVSAGVFVLLVSGAGVTLGVKTHSEADRLVTNPMATRRLPNRTPIDFGMLYDELSVVTDDGLRLVGWYVPTKNGAVIIAQHGYKADRGEMLNEAAMLHKHGYGVLIPSLRTHDMSDGELITFGRHEIGDLERWYRLALEQPDVDASRIGAVGNSLGGSLVIELAARVPGIRAVATNSAFSSLPDTLDTSVRFFTGLPPFPFAPMIAFWAERKTGITVADVDASRWVGRISPRPILIMQGGADVVISIGSGRRLFDAAGEPKELWFDEQVGHSRFDTARPDEYERRVVGFFDRFLPGSQPADH